MTACCKPAGMSSRTDPQNAQHALPAAASILLRQAFHYGVHSIGNLNLGNVPLLNTKVNMNLVNLKQIN